MLNVDLSTIDADWAWTTYSPDMQRPWTRGRAAHLYRRAGFAATTQQLDAAVQKNPADVVADLFSASESPEYQGEIDSLAQTALASGDAANLSAWWAYRMLTSPDQLQEKCTLLWHGHFATSGEKVTDPRLMHRQNELLRRHALGNFGQLVHDVSRDPAMLIYLDSATNRKSHPNENYAREVMELFCLGEGEYTEKDIRELARCFTGWEIRNGEFRFNRFQHDGGTKTILGQTGNFSGEEGVDIVLKQAACPRFIVTKLIRFFMFDEPQPPASLVEPLADEFRAENYALEPVLRRILSSNLFYSDACIGRKVRSPVEFAAGLLRGLEGSTNAYELARGMGELGQRLFFPPNVKGWDGGRTWINSSTLLARANLIRGLLDRNETRFAGGALAELVDKLKLTGSRKVVDWLAELFLAVDLPSEIGLQLVRQAESGGPDREQRLRNTVHLITTLPEFQLS